MSPSRVVCLGLAVLDVVQRVQSPPEWGTKGVAESVELAAGGPATNAAIAAAALGSRVVLITALGSSPQASVVRAECESLGLEVLDLSTDDWELPVASCIVDADGERTVVSTGALTTTHALGEAGSRFIEGLSPTDVLLLDGHHPAAAEEALSIRPPGMVAVLDAGSAKPHAERWLPGLDVVAGSADYASGLGLSHDEAIRHILDGGAGAAVITDGAGPVRWRTSAGDEGEASPPQATVVDTLGAGDAWHGAFAAALAQGIEFGPAVEAASRVASLRVSHVGARKWLASLDHVGWSAR